MFRSGIKICHGPVKLSITHGQGGRLKVTQARAVWLVAGVLLTAGAVAVWLAWRPEDQRHVLSHYLVGVLLLTPGVWALCEGLRPRPLVIVDRGELVVSYGPVFIERTVARLPVDGLEVRVRAEMVQVARPDGDGTRKRRVSVRLLSVVNPLPAGGGAEGEVKVHVLEVRNAGQEQWLDVLGSQVGSEVENARLAIAAETGGVEVEIEGEPEDASSV